MNAHLFASGLLAAGLAVSVAHAQPAPSPKPARACFFKQQMNGWKEVGDRQVNIRVGVRDVYVIALASPCWNLKWSQALGVEARGSSSICTGDTVDVIVPDHVTGPDRCWGQVTKKLTPEEVAALPPKQRP
jgi:hypothetical protein